MEQAKILNEGMTCCLLKRIKLCLTVLIVIFCNMILMAQTSRLLFNGKVLDRETMAPVPGVNISIAGSRRGCSTNPDGDFSVKIYTRPVYLNVSHVGYETQKIWLDSTVKTITILLNPYRHLLGEVEIKAETKSTPFFKDKKYAVLDYEVDSNFVYLLIYRFRLDKAEILCKSLDGDTIALSVVLPFKPEGLFLDCMHNLHVLTKDSAYQVVRQNGTLMLCYATDIKRFKTFLFDCVISTDSLLFFRKESPNQLNVEFYQVNRQNSQKKLLTAVGDKEKLKMLSQNPQEYAYLLMHEPPRNYDDVITWLWLKKIVYKTNTSSLHWIKDILVVFNTADYTLELYTMNGMFTSKLRMPVPDVSDGRWTTEIYIDKTDYKAYTSFMTKSGNFTLWQINLNTGELKRKLTAEHGYPQKVRIHKNFLFYLYDIPGEGDNKLLYRQKL